MSDETGRASRSDLEPTSQKRTWTQPRIESVEGRQARGAVFSYGGPDGGFYS